MKDKNDNMIKEGQTCLLVLKNGTRMIGKIVKQVTGEMEPTIINGKAIIFTRLTFKSSFYTAWIHDYWSRELEIIYGYNCGCKEAIKVLWLRIKYYLLRIF